MTAIHFEMFARTLNVVIKKKKKCVRYESSESSEKKKEWRSFERLSSARNDEQWAFVESFSSAFSHHPFAPAFDHAFLFRHSEKSRDGRVCV